jgi:hypothetical protein
MVKDTASLVREALTILHCDSNKISAFDHHSTIELSFNSVPSVFISEDSGNVWLWSQVMDYDENLLLTRSEAVLMALLNRCAWSVTGQLHLGNGDGRLELKVLLHPDYLHEAERFAEALEDFYERLKDLSDKLKL